MNNEVLFRCSYDDEIFCQMERFCIKLGHILNSVSSTQLLKSYRHASNILNILKQIRA